MSKIENEFLRRYGKLPNDSQYLELLELLIGMDGVTIKSEYKGLYEAELLDFPENDPSRYVLVDPLPLLVGPFPLKDLILSCILEIENEWGTDDDFSITDDVNKVLGRK